MAIARSKMPIENTTIENKLYNILTDFEIKFKKQYAIGYYVFDCYLPDYNILIECNGDYWHNLPNSKRNDKAKSTYIEKYFPQMKLYYIWEHEFKCHDKVCRLIEYWTGLNKEAVDFDFSKISMRELDDVKEYKYFISNYHYLQSAGNPIYKYGFFIGEELIAVCLYGYPTRKESAIRLNVGYKEVLELTRLCIHPKYHKQNFASWIISKTIKKLKQLKKYKYLLSFSDKTFNHIGTVYKASNWQFDGVVPPSYWYVDNSGFVMNKKTLYNHARSLRMKEKDFAELYEYHKVKGNIKLRFIYEL
jgi:very-short-patch-repair endonuclease